LNLRSRLERDGHRKRGTTAGGAASTRSLVYDVDQKRDWDAIIARLNSGNVSEMRIQMGSAGSAQVTAVRLKNKWNNLRVRTEGDTLILTLAG